MKIKDLPLNERPREKAKRYGFDSLSNNELLAIILVSGVKNMNVMQLATNLLSEIGGINGLVDTSYYTLKKMYGIKEAKAMKLASVVELIKRIDINSNNKEKKYIEDLLLDYQKNISSSYQEKLILVIVNASYEIMKEKLLYIGTDKEIVVSSRDIFREVYYVDAKCFYLVHTHPSGIAEASEFDIISTKEIALKAHRAGLKLLNHYIVTPDSVCAIMKERN